MSCKSCNSPQDYLQLFLESKETINEVIKVYELKKAKSFETQIPVKYGDPARIFQEKTLTMHQTRAPQFNRLEDLYSPINLQAKKETATPANDLCSYAFKEINPSFGFDARDRLGFSTYLKSKEICAEEMFLNKLNPVNQLAEIARGLSIITGDYKTDTARAVIRRWAKRAWAIPTEANTPKFDLASFGTALPTLTDLKKVQPVNLPFLMYIYHTYIVPNAEYFASGYINGMPLVKIYLSALAYNELLFGMQTNNFLLQNLQANGDPQWLAENFMFKHYQRIGPFIPVVTNDVPQGNLVNGQFAEISNRVEIPTGYSGTKWEDNQQWYNADVTSIIIPTVTPATMWRPEYPTTLGSGTVFGKVPMNLEWEFRNVIDNGCNFFGTKGQWVTADKFALDMNEGADKAIELFFFNKGMEYYTSYAKAPVGCENEDACDLDVIDGCPCPGVKCVQSYTDPVTGSKYLEVTYLKADAALVPAAVTDVTLTDGSHVDLVVAFVSAVDAKKVYYNIPVTHAKMVPSDICGVTCITEELACVADEVAFKKCFKEADLNVETKLNVNLKCNVAGDTATVTYGNGETGVLTLVSSDLPTKTYVWSTVPAMNTFAVCCEKGGIAKISCISVDCAPAATVDCEGNPAPIEAGKAKGCTSC